MQAFYKNIIATLPSRPMLTKMATFGLIGIGNALVDLAIFTLAYQIFESPLILANVIAWAVAVSCSYFLNTMITFRAESGRVLRRSDYLRFVASGIFGVIATTITLVILANFVSVLIAKLLSMLVSFVINFTLSHFVVFRMKVRT